MGNLRKVVIFYNLEQDEGPKSITCLVKKVGLLLTNSANGSPESNFLKSLSPKDLFCVEISFYGNVHEDNHPFPFCGHARGLKARFFLTGKESLLQGSGHLFEGPLLLLNEVLLKNCRFWEIFF